MRRDSQAPNNPFGNFMPPAADPNAAGMNDMAANLAKQYAMGQLQQQFEQNKGYFSFLSVEGLKVYFDVTNTYVLHKIKIMLLPCLLKEDDWQSGSKFVASDFGGDDDDDAFTPRNYLQAPDLYIPLMSFVTFILITGFNLGQAQDFSADRLTYIFSKTLFLWCFEALVLKGMFMCFNFGNPYFTELMCYTGYKFVILCLVMLAQTFGGTMISYGVMAFLSLPFCYFYYCTFRRQQTAHTLAEHAAEGSHSLNKKTFQLANCALQFALIWLISYN